MYILECSRSPEVYRCRYWDPYHSGMGFLLGLWIRNRDSIFHTGSQYVLISTAVDRRYMDIRVMIDGLGLMNDETLDESTGIVVMSDVMEMLGDARKRWDKK